MINWISCCISTDPREITSNAVDKIDSLEDLTRTYFEYFSVLYIHVYFLDLFHNKAQISHSAIYDEILSPVVATWLLSERI